MSANELKKPERRTYQDLREYFMALEGDDYPWKETLELAAKDFQFSTAQREYLQSIAGPTLQRAGAEELNSPFWDTTFKLSGHIGMGLLDKDAPARAQAKETILKAITNVQANLDNWRIILPADSVPQGLQEAFEQEDEDSNFDAPWAALMYIQNVFLPTLKEFAAKDLELSEQELEDRLAEIRNLNRPAREEYLQGYDYFHPIDPREWQRISNPGGPQGGTSPT